MSLPNLKLFKMWPVLRVVRVQFLSALSSIMVVLLLTDAERLFWWLCNVVKFKFKIVHRIKAINSFDFYNWIVYVIYLFKVFFLFLFWNFQWKLKIKYLVLCYCYLNFTGFNFDRKSTYWAIHTGLTVANRFWKKGFYW